MPTREQINLPVQEQLIVELVLEVDHELSRDGSQRTRTSHVTASAAFQTCSEAGDRNPQVWRPVCRPVRERTQIC